TSEATIDTLALVISASVGVGESAGIGIALAGAVTVNSIDIITNASITGSSNVTSLNAGVTLLATDNSTISGNAVGGLVAIGVGSEAGVSVGVLAAAAVNNITSTTTALIDSSTVISSGGVSLTANSSSTIRAFALGLAGVVGGGSSAGVAIGGAGSGSGNIIR